MRLLVVEDDPDLNRQLATALTDAGYVVDRAFDGEEGHYLGESEPYDAVILDIGLPKMDGISVLEAWRRAGRAMPVLVLTARDRWSDKVQGFDAGADDYVAKPFHLEEVLARVRALLRRSDALARNARMEAGRLDIGNLGIDPVAREVQVDGKPVELTPREFDLLHFFARHPGKVFSRLDLLNQVWGYQHDGYEHTVNTHINRLRMKIETDPAQPSRILTVWGRGYKLAGQEDGA